MNKLFLRVNSTNSFLIYQIGRFSTVALMNIIMAKSYLPLSDLGKFESFVFYSSAISFFWITGISQGILSIYNRKDYYKTGKNAVAFNAVLIILALSLTVSIVLALTNHIISKEFLPGIPKKNVLILLLYLLIYPSGFIIEYILLLEKKYKSLVRYAFFSMIFTLLVVTIPPYLKLDLKYSIYGLYITACVKILILLFLLNKYSQLALNYKIIKELLKISLPLIGTSLIIGSASYIDGFIVSQKFDSETFVVFRYGAREFPLFLLIPGAFSTSIIPLFSNTEKLSENLALIKNKSRQYIIYLFPLAICLLFTSQYIFEIIFNKHFYESYYIFDIYLLLIISRFVFPTTILTGMRINNVLFYVSIIELLINISVSLILLSFIGYPGVAYGTIIAYFSEKVILVLYVKKKLKLNYSSYIPFKELLIFSSILITSFIIKVLIIK